MEREDASIAALKEIYLEEEEKKNLEVNALEKLKHPHIIQYHESFISDGYLCIVIDYAEGGDLASRIKTSKSKGYHFPEAQIWRWFMQICIALNYIHENKIIHRDLKSHNIFLTKTGDIKIGDFGICRVLTKSDEFASTSIGTPYYIAPEVCKGKPYDYKADVWSLGCVMYELCSLNRPFQGESIATVLNSILTKSPSALPEQYSEPLKSCILSMLAKKHKERPTVQEIISCINTSLASEGKPGEQIKAKKAHQKEISITIPLSSNASTDKSIDANSAVVNLGEPISAENLEMIANHGASTNRNNTHFSFNESLLKQCPTSPIRPMLMGDFLKRRLGEDVFERIQRLVNNSKDPVKLLHEESWIFSDICGENNLSIIDAGIACGGFNVKARPIFPNTSTNRVSRIRAFPILAKNATQ